MIEPALLISQKNHIKDNPDHIVFCGMNFIECMTCKKHAHMLTWPPENVYLLLHNNRYDWMEKIEPNEF